MAAARHTCLALLYCGTASLAAGALAAFVLLQTRSQPTAILILFAAALLAGHYAGLRLGEKAPGLHRREAAWGAILTAAIAAFVAGTIGAMLGAVTGIALYRKLKQAPETRRQLLR